MAKWWLKAAIHRTLAAIPGAHRINELFQVYVTRSLDLTTSRFHNKLKDCQTHLRHYTEYSGEPGPPRKVVELGSGWYPVTPLGMYLCGAEEVITCDIAPLLKPARVRAAMQRIVEYYDQKLLAEYWPQVDPQRLNRIRELLAQPNLKTTEDLLGPLGIRVLVCDAQELPLETSSVDLITSYGVLMHIDAQVLARVLKQFRRVAKPTAVTSHWVDLCDLYYWADSSISPLNFLRYTDEAWRWINDPLVPASRLRLPDYRRVFAAAGFELVEEENRWGEERDLERVPLAPKFSGYDRRELLALDTWLAARISDPLPDAPERLDRRNAASIAT